ncbi:ABC transporter [Microbacterium sp. AZCO]|uniref:ABC transporter n=1 Tax=Microbacterium sp. AZCO TaxID=3142976 RepID=UPI0031F40739
MSEPQSSYGEPVAEPKPVDDVVGSANEGLVDAEAAGRDAVTDADRPAEEPAAAEPAAEAPAVHEQAAHEPAAPEPAVAPVPEAAAPETTDDEITDAAAYTAAYNAASAGDDEPAAQSSVAQAAYDPAAPTVVAPAVAPSEPVATEAAVAPAAVAPAAVAPQPIFVQAPEAPRPRGNRAAAGAIGLLAALSFAVLYLAAWLFCVFFLGTELGGTRPQGGLTAENAVTAITAALTSWIFWTPVVVFFFSFWLLGAIINRGRWGHWVIFGLFVGVLSWFGFILGEYFQAPFWRLTPTEGLQLLKDNLFAPLAVIAFIIGRELTIWFGAWAAARGKRVTELNTEAMREYERTLEAGPQLYRQ